IHFATEGGHVDTLEALLKHPKINPNLQVEGRTALHIAVENTDLTCARLLLERGASANIPDSEGRTALQLATTTNQWDMVALIVQKCTQFLSLDEYEANGDQTLREVIQQTRPELALPSIPEDTEEVLLQDLKNYLSVNDEENFMKNIILLRKEFPHEMVEELLKIAAERGFHKAAIGILKKFEGRQFSVKKAAQAAVEQSDHVILQALLKVEPNAANDLILSACLELGLPGTRGADYTPDRLKCLELILEKENVNVRCSDNEGNTPLHYAASGGCQEAVTLFLNRGSYIGHMNKFNVPPIADISAHTLSRYFDDCLQCLQTRRDRANEYAIEFNYRCLMPHDDFPERNNAYRATREMEVFKYIAGNGSLKHLLKHPLLSSFLYLKWHRIRHVLYANFAFYMIFYLVLNAYILSKTYDTQIENRTQIDNDTTDRPLASTLRIVWCQNNSLRTFTTVMLLLFILREVVQFVSCIRSYLTSLRNWLEVALITLTIALLCGAGVQVGAVVILLSAWELVILISQHSRLSTGIEMFRTVSFNYMRFLVPYLFLILAFALAFYTLFKDGNNTKFPDPGLSLFKTVIMLTGEFDASNIPFISHFIWSHIVFMLFVFFIAIVLFNLLNGLAVSDTAEILSKAELVGLISRIRLITYIEHVAVGEPFRHCSCCNSRLTRWNPFGFLAKRILMFPYFLRDGKISVKPCDSLDAYDNDRYYEKYVRSESIKRDKQWITLKMDPDIIKQAKRIIYNKNQLTDNE
ncbi:transient receptor potential cation channel protein painless-like, partial [Temnothorax curvispinosus]|uniref:Transient receptor potential cation channel protein painless-like n=1 Tax=Temnothorax curvispinosus TaxID=300111 RepID=A0A6J1QD31_9HYME